MHLQFPGLDGGFVGAGGGRVGAGGGKIGPGGELSSSQFGHSRPQNSWLRIGLIG